MKKLSLVSFIIGSIAICMMFFAAPVVSVKVAQAAGPEAACANLSAKEKKNNPICNSVGTTDNPVTGTIRNVSTLMALVGGVVAVIYVILGGFYFVTSNGDPQKAANGRTTLIYALIGLVIIIAAQTIVLYILGKFK